jgi:hypothetical protein
MYIKSHKNHEDFGEREVVTWQLLWSPRKQQATKYIKSHKTVVVAMQATNVYKEP